jgi:hypothetical protein
MDSMRVSHLGEYRLPRILPDDSHYFCALVPEVFSLVTDMSMSSAEAIGIAGLGATPRTTAEGIQTRSQARAGASDSKAAVPRVAEHEEEEEAEEPGLPL